MMQCEVTWKTRDPLHHIHHVEVWVTQVLQEM